MFGESVPLTDRARQFADDVLREFCCGDSTQTATKGEIEGAGQNSPTGATGSYVYAAYDSKGVLLYVGETGKSIKRRFRDDGSGAHKHKSWYTAMKTVKYKRLCLNSKYYRKLLERALILAGRPTCQGEEDC